MDSTTVKKDIKLFRIILIYFCITGVSALIAVAWNNVFLALLKKYFPDNTQSLLGSTIYALSLTIIGALLLLIVFGTGNVQHYLVNG